MANPFDQFDQPANPFDQFDAPSLHSLGEQSRATIESLPKGDPVKPESWGDLALRTAKYAGQTGGFVAREGRRGLGALAGAPVDLVNLIMGATGVPVSNEPFMGGQSIDKGMSAPIRAVGGNPDPQAQDPLQRILGRIGQEVGASALPAGLAMAAAKALGPLASRIMANAPGLKSIPGAAVHAASTNPAAFAGREAGFATAAGTGAGLANEAVGAPQHGANFMSDFIGSLGGTGALATMKSGGGALASLYSAVTRNPQQIDDVVGRAVADRLINNSSTLAEQYGATGSRDVQSLADQFRRPAPIEEAIPGYRANIGDRTQDPAMATFAFDQDARYAGMQNNRMGINEKAVDERMAGLDPGGDPSVLRAALEASRTRQIAEADMQAQLDAVAAENAARVVQPVMGTGAARGSSIRSAIEDANNRARGVEREAWRPIREADVAVDPAPLADSFTAQSDALSQAERMKFQPPEAAIPARLAAPPEAPAPTGLLGPDGLPIVRPPESPPPVPLTEATGLRSALSTTAREARAKPGGANEGRVVDSFIERVDRFVDENVPPELREAYEAARAATVDRKDRFARPGTGIGDSLRTREGGGYQLSDDAVPSRFTPTDRGRVDDFRALIREAGTDPRARNALADEVMADVEAKRLTTRPEALEQYLSDRQIMLGEFPELTTRLRAAGVATTTAETSAHAAENTTTQLTKPGQSAMASYLKYGDERAIDAIRTVTNSPKPREAARELLEAAGNTPEARQHARTALWKDIESRGKQSAPGVTQQDRWNGKKLLKAFEEPKNAAVADELWSDAPQELADIRTVFKALAGAEGSMRARAAGSSGTAQAMSGKFDPALSMSSVASRMRSVNRGVLSPGIAAIDIAATWARGRAEQVQTRAIETLSSAVVNNPGMAADLLEKFNPADYAARRRLISQKYGVRATQLLNLLDEANDSDPVKDAVMGKNQ